MRGTFQDLLVDAWNATCGHFNFSAKSKGQWLQSQGGREACMSGPEWHKCRAAQPRQLTWFRSQPHVCLQWLNTSKTWVSLTLEAKKLCWLMSHFSFFLFFFVCCEWPLFSCCCFMTIKKKNERRLCKYYIHLFGLEGSRYKRNPGLIFFFHPDLKGISKLWATLSSAPDLKLGSSVSSPETCVGEAHLFIYA